MADLSSLLAALELDPDDAKVYDALAAAARQVPSDMRAARFAATRTYFSARHRPDVVVQLLDVELAATDVPARQADLWIEKGWLLDSELLDVEAARQAFLAAIALRADDVLAHEALEELKVAAGNWQTFAAKFIHEASVSSDRSLATGLYISAAECYLRFAPDAPEAEQWLRRALHIDSQSTRAAYHLSRLLRRSRRWEELAAMLDQRASHASNIRDRIAALIALYDVARGPLGDSQGAERAAQRVLALDPTHPRAERMRGPPSASDRPRVSGSLEIAELAESSGNYEKAIDAWKHILRADPGSESARTALARLCRRTEKWNALLDLSKDDLDRLAESEVAARVAKLFEIAEIYRDHLKLDSMVLQTHQAILKIDPSNPRAADELADRLRSLGRWNDVIAVLTRRAEHPATSDAQRLRLLREVADLWFDRLGNAANAIGPLEQILALAPTHRDALTRLKEIYAKRRQWRQLVELLGKEAETLPDDERVAKRTEMARIAAERLGDNRLAIELYNRVLSEAGVIDEIPRRIDIGGVLAALADLYDREKRFVALVEIVHRQADAAMAGNPGDKRAAIAACERLGQIYGERLRAPQQAALAWQRVFELDPNHAKALRALRELYLTSGDVSGLETLFVELRLEDELIDALQATASRSDDRAVRLSLVERAALLADKRASAVDAAEEAIERARQAWERVLAVDARHGRAASALASIYERQQKWPRLLAMREVELDAAADAPSQLAKIAQIRDLCEHRLGSKSLAFSWVIRAFELEPSNSAAYNDVLRLASEPDQWRDVVGAFERAIARGSLSETAQLQAFRDLAKIAQKRLADPEMARGYNRKVLQLAPADREAELDLERLATQAADWNELLGSLRRRAKRSTDPAARASVLLQAGMIQEQKLADPHAAAVSYREALEARPGDMKVLRSLARVEEARGDWASLVDVLAQELALMPTGQRFEPLMQLGAIELTKLRRPGAALVYYRQALALAGPGIRPQPVEAIAKLVLDPPMAATLAAGQRVAAAREILPHLAHADQFGRQAAALLVIRESDDSSAAEKIDIDRVLMRLFDQKLGDAASAWAAGLRVIAAVPDDAVLRAAMKELAGRLGRDTEWAEQLRALHDRLRAEGGAPRQLRELASELAQFATDRLADHDTAEAAWISVLEVEADAADAFAALADLYRARERWLDLRALLERRGDVTSNEDERVGVWLQLGALEDAILGEGELATSAYRRALELDPTCEPAQLALERLYAEAENWRALEALLAGRDDRRPESARSPERLIERAKLLAHHLGDPQRAVDLLDDILQRTPDHIGARELLEKLVVDPKAATCRLSIARILEPLHAAAKQWRRHVAMLRVLREFADGPEAVELLIQIALESETELAAPQDAFDAWKEVLALDPGNDRARGALVRIAEPLVRWRELAVSLEAAVAAIPPGDRTTRVAVLRQLADTYETKLADSARAIGAYQRWRDADPTAATVRHTAAALVRLYESGSQWAELRAALRMQAEVVEDPDERINVLRSSAKLEEEKLGDRVAAIATWRTILRDRPYDSESLSALERLLEVDGRWQDLVDLLRSTGDASVSSDRVEILRRIAHICDRRLGQCGDAIAAWREVLDCDAEHQEALVELARLYRAEGRHDELYDICLRQLARLDGQAQATGQNIDLHVEIAQLLEGPMTRVADGLEHWRVVLELNPHHALARSAVEASLHDDELWSAAAEILQPVYVATGHHEALVSLLLQRGERVRDPVAKFQDYREVVSLCERYLNDKQRAFDVHLRALACAANEPDLPGAIATAERLAGELGRPGDLIDVYRTLAPDVLDAEVQRRLYLDVADLLRAIRGDTEAAALYYSKVLDSTPNDARATAALENIYRSTGNTARLVDILLKQGSPEFGASVEDQVSSLVEAAGLYVGLNRPDDAVTTWELALSIAPDRADVIYALEKFYREQGRWKDVVELYEHRLGFVTSIEEAVALRVQLAELHESRGDVEDAVDNYAAALDGNVRHPAARAALERLLSDPAARLQVALTLEPLYIAEQRWPDLVRVYQAKLDATDDPGERLKFTRYVARLYEEQLEDYQVAAHWYARAFREAPSEPQTRDQLQRLGGLADAWNVVAEAYQSYLDEESEPSATVRDVAVAVATIYDRRLSDTERAVAAYRRALGIEVATEGRDSREVMGRLEELLGRTRRWNDLIAIYDEVIAETSLASLRVETETKRARLFEDGLQDVGKAIDAWRLLAEHTDDGLTDSHVHSDAVQQLERLYRVQSQWRELADLLESRLTLTSDLNGAAELRLKLAAVYEAHLDDLASAIDHYRNVLNDEPLADRALSALERLVVHDHHRAEIIGLLEPIYRQADWWQKLVVILDAKLEFIADPAEQVATLHEIADIHDVRGGALDLAFAALERAWRIDVCDDAALTKLLVLAGKLGIWSQAADAIESGANAAPNDELAAGLWSQAAEIRELQCSDRKRAIDAWRKVDELRPNDAAALAALDRLLALEGRGVELAHIVDRRAEQTNDGSVRLILLHRAAALYDDVVGDRGLAVAAYRRVLDMDDADLTALDELERLYRDSGDVRELAAILERKIELTADDSARQMLHHSVAVVYEVQLKDAVAAAAHLAAALRIDGGDAAALGDLDRIHTAHKQWPELIEVLDRRASLAADPEVRADLAYRAAGLVEVELGDVDAALSRYRDLLELVPSHASTRAALERLLQRDDLVEAAASALEPLYRVEANVAGLRHVFERRLAATDGDPSARRADWSALAQVYEEIALDPAGAVEVWARAWADAPEDIDVLTPLVRLAETANPSLWPRVAELLQERLRQTDLPGAVDQAYAMRLGQISEDRLHDLDAAAAAFDRASRGPEPRPALASLERVLARGSQAQRLAEVLARQAELAEDDATAADFLFRKADLSETVLGARAGAIATYIDVLALVPTHGASRAALHRLSSIADEEHRFRILDVLEPLFEQEGDTAQLIGVLETRLTLLDDPQEYARVSHRVAALWEVGLGDRTRALDATLRWLNADPGSPEAQSETVRLALAIGAWRETEARVAAIAADVEADELDPEDHVSLLVLLGDIRRKHLDDTEGAIAAYRAALRFDPGSSAALDPLIELLRAISAWSALADALRQRARVASQAEHRRAALAEVAGLCERAGDRFGAIAAWRNIVDDDGRDSSALAELARIYRGSGLTEDRVQLIDVLGRAAQLAENVADEKRLRIEIAELEAIGARAVDSAGGRSSSTVSRSPSVQGVQRWIDAWRAVVDLDPTDLTALAQLEAAHASAGDWNSVYDVQARRLDIATDAADKLSICAEMARVSEQQRNSLDDAIAAWYASLDIDSTSARAYDELERLLATANRYRDLLELLHRRAALQAGQGDRVAQIQTLGQAADICERNLDDTDAAMQILNEILARDPGCVSALTRLSAIHERAGDWTACKATLELALQQNPQGRDAADLYFRLGEVARSQDRDVQTALQHFQYALRQDGRYLPAITALEHLARERGDDVLLIDMLNRRSELVSAAAERLDCLIEIAALDGKAGRYDAALTALTSAAQLAPDDIRVLAPLADLYVASGRLDNAAPIYDRLAADALSARRMKDVAKYRQRQGGILEARGDRSGAQAAYEEAIRINPTDVPTMVALGRLYFANSDWDKARRIYQSLVLQNIDSNSGVSKGEVYWTLGAIHLELGQPVKAKSMWQRGLEIEPNHQALKDSLARLG